MEKSKVGDNLSMSAWLNHRILRKIRLSSLKLEWIQTDIKTWGYDWRDFRLLFTSS